MPLSLVFNNLLTKNMNKPYDFISQVCDYDYDNYDQPTTFNFAHTGKVARLVIAWCKKHKVEVYEGCETIDGDNWNYWNNIGEMTAEQKVLFKLSFAEHIVVPNSLG